MSFPHFHGINLAEGGYIKNFKVEELQEDPVINQPGRIWYNIQEDAWKYSAIIDNILQINYLDKDLDPYYIHTTGNIMTSEEAMNFTPSKPNTLLYISDANEYVYWNNKWYFCVSNEELYYIGIGTGEAGTYTESFEDLNEVNSNFIFNDISKEIDNNDPKVWNINSGSTPSSNTGPDAAYDQTYYIYTETSSGGDTIDYYMITSNFHELTEIKLNCHMYGSDIGTFDIDIWVDGVNGSWDNIYTISGDQGNSWFEIILDTTNLKAEKIRFHYYNIDGFRGDFAIDNLTLTSI